MGVFFSERIAERVRSNVARDPHCAALAVRYVRRAAAWRAMDDEQLWQLMFGTTITRSAMVWSNGVCPQCRQGVPMYNWEIDFVDRPWKARCPHCGSIFPTNDFGRFYRSGLDERGIFDPRRADRTLLCNAEHPGPEDPLRSFGVDDGEGYVEGDARWRFIGAYLYFGQWKQGIIGGVKSLAAHHLLTGDPDSAHRVGIILDRVADLYPTFDWSTQALAYEQEQSKSPGYVSPWHDACSETREMAFAWDIVKDSLEDDGNLVAFLSAKAKRHGLENGKRSFTEIRQNIEGRIFGDALAHREKISCNYPSTDVTVAIMHTVLGWPATRDEVHAILDALIAKSAAVDGVSGEKGLMGYSCNAPVVVGMVLELFERVEPGFLRECLKRHPEIHRMFRFHIDTWISQRYYPLVGDGGYFGRTTEQYMGMHFFKDHGFELGIHSYLLAPSMFTFLWRLYRETGDADFIRVLYHAANTDTTVVNFLSTYSNRLLRNPERATTDGIPFDFYCDDPGAVRREVAEVVRIHGPSIRVGSVNKEQWHIAILRSGEGAHERAAWIEYDSGGWHGSANGMNLGLFAKGLDLLPDFGYPPVNFGGWDSRHSRWYKSSPAHNTVVVDLLDHQREWQRFEPFAGRTTLWADGRSFRAIRVSGPEIAKGCSQFERTIAVRDLSPDRFYILDVFRVCGGRDHAKFTHSTFGKATAERLSLAPDEEYDQERLLRGFRTDRSPAPGWHVDWAIEDPHGLGTATAPVRLRYTDLTAGATASLAEGWVLMGQHNTVRDAWIPWVIVRRRTETAPLLSTFVSVIEVYEGEPRIARVRRLPLAAPDGRPYPDACVGLAIELADGSEDVFIAADVENPSGLSPAYLAGTPLAATEHGTRCDGELALVHLDSGGQPRYAALCRGASLRAAGVELAAGPRDAFREVDFRTAGRGD